MRFAVLTRVTERVRLSAVVPASSPTRASEHRVDRHIAAVDEEARRSVYATANPSDEVGADFFQVGVIEAAATISSARPSCRA